MKRLALVLATILLTALSAHSQTVIKYYPHHVEKGAPIPQECLAAGASLIHQLLAFPHPAKWTYIISCDDLAWSDTMMAARNDRGKLIFGATNPDNATTLLRGTTLRGEGDVRMTPEHLVAHELAHIYLHSNDEGKVDKLAQSWIVERHPPVALVASTQ